MPPPKTAIRQIATGGGAAFGPAAGPVHGVLFSGGNLMGWSHLRALSTLQPPEEANPIETQKLTNRERRLEKMPEKVVTFGPRCFLLSSGLVLFSAPCVVFRK